MRKPRASLLPQTNPSCFLPPVDVSFVSSDIYASYEIPKAIRKLLRSHGVGFQERGGGLHWYKGERRIIEQNGLK